MNKICEGYTHSLCTVASGNSLFSADEVQTPQYQAVLQHKDQLAKSLASGPDQYLLSQLKIRGWLASGAAPSAPELVDLALQRIRFSPSEYEVFIGMLQDDDRVRAVVDAIIGMYTV